MNKTEALAQLKVLSSGTIATLTGLTNYDAQDSYMQQMYTLLETVDVEECRVWPDVWRALKIAEKAIDEGREYSVKRGVVVVPGKPAEACMVDTSLKGLQEIVNGYIEAVTLSDKTCLFCNEEGKLLGLPWNRPLRGDVIAGTFILVGFDEDGETISISDEEADRWMTHFNRVMCC